MNKVVEKNMHIFQKLTKNLQFTIAVMLIILNAVGVVIPRAIFAQDFSDITNIDETFAKSEKDKDDNKNLTSSSAVKYYKPSADSRVEQSDPKVNFGNSKYLTAGKFRKKAVESYIKFKSKNGSPTKLYIYMVNGKPSSFSVYSSKSNWSEKKITWNNKPGKKNKLDGSPSKSGSWWVFDVSGASKDGDEYSFVVTSSSDKPINFYSAEGKHSPRLAFSTAKTPKPSSTVKPSGTPKPTTTAQPGNTSSPSSEPTSSPEDTSNPGATNSPSPTCDPGIDCGNDGETTIQIDETDDGVLETDSPNPTGSAIPTCDPGIDCGDDSNVPTPTGTSNGCLPGIDCSNDSTGSPVASPTRTATPTNTGTAKPSSTANQTASPTQTANSTPVGGGTGTSTGSIPADGVVKIAFTGDTGINTNFSYVMRMVKAQGAQALVISGDLAYDSNPASAKDYDFALNSVLGPSFPVFMTQGNHEKSSWPGYVPIVERRLAALGITPEGIIGDVKSSTVVPPNYAITFKGIKFAFGPSTGSTGNINTFLSNDNHIWKVCSWHENSSTWSLGYKSGVSAAVYDECRKVGGIATQGHWHAYARSKTLTNFLDGKLTLLDGSSSQETITKGSSYTFVDGTGGASFYGDKGCGTACNYYATLSGGGIVRNANTSGVNHGATFISFGDGGPRKATAYHMETDGTTSKITDQYTITAP